MDYVPFGRTGILTSRLALGTMNLFDAGGIGGADEDESGRIIAAYRDAGGNFFDTADAYGGGRVESELGRVFRGVRDRMVIATKVGLSTDRDDVNAGGNSRKAVRRAVTDSLRRLQTDYIDVLWAHTRDAVTPTGHAVDALLDEVRAGRVLHIGLSNWTAWETAAVQSRQDALGDERMAGIQVKYNLLDRDAERELLPMADRLGLAVTAWAPLAGGVLSGKYTSSRRGPARFDELGRAPSDHRLAVARAVDLMADEAGMTAAQLALGWMLAARGPVVTPVIGARSRDQLTPTLDASSIAVPPEIIAALDRLSPPAPTYPHTFLAQQGADGAVHGDRHADARD